MKQVPASVEVSTPVAGPPLLLATTFLLAASPLRASDVWPPDLAQLIAKADKLVVLESPRQGAKVLFESAERRDLDALKSALKVESPEQFLHCMCDGTPALVLFAKGEKIGQITNHHAKLIRCSLWKSDATLVDAEALLKWFDDRKVPGPRKEYELGLKLQKEANEAERKWLAAMPPALRPHWATSKRSIPFEPDLAPLRKALEAQVADKNERILALFSWYGSGRGPWSGFPAYEDIAEKLLLDYRTPELLAAVEGKELNRTQIEGVARLFGGWTFSQHRPNDLKLLPPKLKTQLLKHSQASDDEDKRARANRAFGQK
jgi:hypothetical protein